MAEILVIDDDELVRTLIKEALQNAGHMVRTAPDGAAGLAISSKQAFDLVITDIVMPEKDGLETIMELRRSKPGVRIIAMSGGGNWLAPSKCLDMSRKLGAYCALPKPITTKDLLHQVQQALSH